MPRDAKADAVRLAKGYLLKLAGKEPDALVDQLQKAIEDQYLAWFEYNQWRTDALGENEAGLARPNDVVSYLLDFGLPESLYKNPDLECNEDLRDLVRRLDDIELFALLVAYADHLHDEAALRRAWNTFVDPLSPHARMIKEFRARSLGGQISRAERRKDGDLDKRDIKIVREGLQLERLCKPSGWVNNKLAKKYKISSARVRQIRNKMKTL